MDVARRLVTLGRAARNDAWLAVRQPLRRALIVLPGGATLDGALVAHVAEELNVHEIESVSGLEGLLTYTVTPNFRRLGPRVGRRMPQVQTALAATDGDAVRRALRDDGALVLSLEGGDVTLEPDDVDLRAQAHEELVLAEDGGYAVALDTTLDDALRSEGWARSLIRSLNERRKTLGLELSDRIRVELAASGAVAEAARTRRGTGSNARSSRSSGRCGTRSTGTGSRRSTSRARPCGRASRWSARANAADGTACAGPRALHRRSTARSSARGS